MAVEQRTVYVTSDQKTFYSEKEAARHERVLKAHNHAYRAHACYGKFEFSDNKEFEEFVCRYADMIRSEQ